MRNLKYDTNEHIYETKTDLWTQRTQLGLPRRREGWRIEGLEKKTLRFLGLAASLTGIARK